jgi:hypothetical protein
MLVTGMRPGRSRKAGRQSDKHRQCFEPAAHLIELHPQASHLS